MGAAWGVDSDSYPVGLLAVAPERRIVAVSLTAAELLQSGSDLAHRARGADRIDLLLVCESSVETAEAANAWDTGDLGDDYLAEDLTHQFRTPDLGLTDLHLHRLDLREPLDARAEQDLVAALSELVGFDPEPGVYLLAPMPDPTNPSRVIIDRAVQRIARVYGLPTLRYRGLELATIPE